MRMCHYCSRGTRYGAAKTFHLVVSPIASVVLVLVKESCYSESDSIYAAFVENARLFTRRV